MNRKLGANDYDAANQAGATAFYSSVGVGLVLAPSIGSTSASRR